jgi:hypothetical protein
MWCSTNTFLENYMIDWKPNQPNNFNGIEDCGNILVDFINSPQPIMLTDGPGATSALSAVCEAWSKSTVHYSKLGELYIMWKPDEIKIIKFKFPSIKFKFIEKSVII